MFPSRGGKSSIAITAADLHRLEPSIYLNDTNVEVYNEKLVQARACPASLPSRAEPC